MVPMNIKSLSKHACNCICICIYTRKNDPKKHACICKYLSLPSYDLSLFLNYIVQDNAEKSNIGLSKCTNSWKKRRFWKKRKENEATHRLEICQKIYTTGFSGQNFYTLKVRKLRLFLLKEKQCICIFISYFSSFFVKTLTVSVQDHTRCVWIF